MKKISTLLLCAFLIIPFSAEAQRKKKDDSKEPKASKYEEAIKDAEKIEGFFTLYKKDGSLMMELTEEQLDQDFLMNFEVSQGIGSSGLYGGTMLNIFEAKLVALEKHEGQIFLVQKPHRYNADEGTPRAAAVDLTYGSSVLETAKVAAEEDGKMLIDVYDWFVGDLSQVSTRIQFAVSSRPGQPGRASFDKSRSYLNYAKSFPENTTIDARLTFKNSELGAPRTVPDGRYIPVSIHYNLVQLPETPMSPRMADDRTGYFMTVHKDFSEEDDRFFKRYINKWRLECADEPDADGLCTPKEQIVYYVDHTVPEEYRQAFMDGINAFDVAFEAAGFRDAMDARMLPEGADAEDIRYATMRWNVSDESGYGAIGPSVVDPRTGEIIDADILYEANMVLSWKRFYRANVDPVAAVNEMFEMSENEAEMLANGGEMASLADEMAAQGTLLRTALMARGELAPDSEVPEEDVYQAMKRVVMHELGHTLGLRHNFRSSADTPFDKLHDKPFTEENGLASSVMEYPGINIAPEGQQQGYYYSPSVGSYDKWVIAYGYTPDDARAEELARQAAEPGHAYGPDEDARGYGALDPDVNVYDLSSDPMKWGMQRAELINGLFAELPDYVLADNVPYYSVTDAFSLLASQYGRAVSTGIKYIGGQYQYRDHYGDPNGRAPFVNVPKERQEEALQFIIEAAFAADAFELPSEVYAKFGADRWSHWGNSNTYNGRIDFPLHEQLSGLQASLLSQVLSSARLSRIRDAEVKFGEENVVTIPELFNGLTYAIWSEVWTAPGSNVPSLRRDLQRAHIDGMTALVTDAPSRVPADARSVARHQLKDLHDRLSRRLSPPYDFDTYTEAHLRESMARIEAALEAGLSLEN
jgi:hypothetical protein